MLGIAGTGVTRGAAPTGAAPTGAAPGEPAGEPDPTDAGAGVTEPPATPAWRITDR